MVSTFECKAIACDTWKMIAMEQQPNEKIQGDTKMNSNISFFMHSSNITNKKAQQP